MHTRAQPMSEPPGLPSPARRVVVGRRDGAPLRWAPAGAGYALLVLCWVFASPFGAAPDEAAHAVRAAAAGGGQWQGRAVAPYRSGPARTLAQADLLDQVAQEFTIPAGLAAADQCFVARPDLPPACPGAGRPAPAAGSVEAVTYETTAPPGAYVLAGLAMRLSVPGLAPGYLGRLALALVCALLLAGAAWAAAARGSLWPLAGLALGATPMALFLGGSLGTAGVTTAAALCFSTGVAAFWLAPHRRGLAPLIAASGVVLGLSSAAGALALAALVVAVLPLVRPRRLAGAGPALASLAVTGALVAGVALALDHRPLPGGRAELAAAALAFAQAAPAVLQQALGVFGRTDVSLPAAAYVVWAGLVVVVVSAALVLGRRRDRLALALVAGGASAAAIGAEALLLAPAGWDLRGSFLLPILVALPVTAGFVLHAARLFPRLDAFLVGAIVVAVHLLALWENARRYAVGSGGPFDFLDVARWAPPGGWPPWLVLGAAGGLLVLLALAPLTRREQDEDAAGPLVVIDPISVGR